ncbi:MAG: DNA polymerase III subunit beta [Helicobacter sp.]|nr:DNA polymerase III subunit beta [Helicobacter sp.]
MECTINKETLEPLLNVLQPFSDKKEFVQITSHVMLTASKEQLICYATDFEMGLQLCSKEITTKQEGRITANAKKLLDIVRNLKNNTPINLKADENILTISQGKSHFKLPSFIAEEFPTFPSYEDANELDITFADLSHDFKKISPTIDTNNQRVEITGMLFAFTKEKIDIVGTDTKRLGIITHPSGNTETSFIIPKQAVLELQKLDFEPDTKVYQTPTILVLKDSKAQCFVRLINGHYPQYEKIIPTSFTHEITLPRDQFLESIRLIETLSNIIELKIKGNEVFFSSINGGPDEKAETSFEIPTNIDDEVLIGINSKQVADFLAHIQTPEFSFKIKDSHSPFVVESENFSTVIIPIIT